MTIKNAQNSLITICTYNISTFSDQNTIVKNIIGLIKTEKITIFCLQEVTKTEGKPFIGDVLQKSLGNDWDFISHLGDIKSHLDHGVAIVWNSCVLQKQDVKSFFLPKLDKIKFPQRILVLATGFKPIPQQRKVLSILFKNGEDLFRVTSFHIDLNGGRKHRLNQHKFLSKFLEENSPLPHEIICGDFNSTRGIGYKNEMEEIQKSYGKDFIEVCSHISSTHDIHDTTFTLPGVTTFLKKGNIHFRQKLDHIYTKGFKPIVAKVVSINGSDHSPLIATLQIKN